MTERPPKGAWKKDVTKCEKRGHHLYKGRHYRDKETGFICSKMVCIEPGCGYEVPPARVIKNA